MYASANKRKISIRDDLPRSLPFNLPLFCINETSASQLPPVRRISLPYQVLPNGNILASQILSIDLLWSPMAFEANAPMLSLRRVVFDAMVSPPISGTDISVPPSDGIQYPYNSPSVIAVFDRELASHSGSSSADIPTVTTGSLREQLDLAVCGEYPIVPSGTLGVWGIFATNDLGVTNFDKSTVNTTAPYRYLFATPVDVSSPNPSSATVSDENAEEVPFAHGRVMYRIVELTPWQHLFVVNKYTNKLNSNDVDTRWDPRANPSINPLVNTTTSPSVWFGS